MSHQLLNFNLSQGTIVNIFIILLNLIFYLKSFIKYKNLKNYDLLICVPCRLNY